MSSTSNTKPQIKDQVEIDFNTTKTDLFFKQVVVTDYPPLKSTNFEVCPFWNNMFSMGDILD